VLASDKFRSLSDQGAADLRVLFRVGNVGLSLPGDAVAGMYEVDRRELLQAGEEQPCGCVGLLDLASPVEVFDISSVLRIDRGFECSITVLVLDDAAGGWWGIMADRVEKIVAVSEAETWPVPLLWQLFQPVPFDRIEGFSGAMYASCDAARLSVLVRGM